MIYEKVAIIGSRSFTNSLLIKKFIFKLKNTKTIIVSGGQKLGADGYAKKYALDFGLEYKEFPPAHYPWNSYCVLPAYEYGKKYSPINFFNRNGQIVEYADIVIAFIPKNTKIEESKGTHDSCKRALKINKKVIVISG